MSCCSSISFALTFPLDIIVTVSPNYPNEDIDPEPEIDPSGRRKPGRPATIHIDTITGIQTSGFSKQDIIGYEIISADGILLTECFTENEFISCLREVDESIEVRILLTDCYYYGWLE
ncbi:MAG: hypothetical protein K2N05_12845 [Muribaculaceae bacterium]|nr:hypothetical protein [Muribaculaceae bacterium]